jgi:hypothetical protein
VLFLLGKKLNLELYVEHLTYPVPFVITTALSLSLSVSPTPVSALRRETGLVFNHNASPSLSTHYTVTYTEPNNDLLQQNAPLHGPKLHVTIHRAMPTSQY